MTTSSRDVVDSESLRVAAKRTVGRPTRFIFDNPMCGGPKLAEVRTALREKGVVRISATKAKVFVDIDPGDPGPALISLDTIARSSAAGLERAILSALGQVDAVLVGIDGRSDEETRKVAEAYADVVWGFEAKDIGLTDEEWGADRIHFANARNLGRMQVQTPWALFLDSDEFIDPSVPIDLRNAVSAPGDEGYGCYAICVEVCGAEQMDPQRLARSEFRWWSHTHNQLAIVGKYGKCGGRIVQDTSIRTAAENDRRTCQRNRGVELLGEEAKKGDVSAIYHMAKHRMGMEDLAEAERLTNELRCRCLVHGAMAQQRAWLALGVAWLYCQRGLAKDIEQAELWCLRSMLDEPRMDSMCLLGDIAEERGDLHAALRWYEAACVLREPDSNNYLAWRTLIDLRMGRRSGIRVALGFAP